MAYKTRGISAGWFILTHLCAHYTHRDTAARSAFLLINGNNKIFEAPGEWVIFSST